MFTDCPDYFLYGMENRSENSRRIKEEAACLGFTACGIAQASRLEDEASHLKKWLGTGFQGEMEYMNRYAGKRVDPTLLVQGAKSVISVIMNYFPERVQADHEAPRISKYAYGRDYHGVIKKRLKKLLNFINEEMGPVNGRYFVDSAPVLDRAWAAKAGLGWIGKNSNLISREFGSFIFIGELVVDLELGYDRPVKDYCGNCTRCIDACPTEAIVADRVIDSRKCISYHTIENKGEIPSEMKDHMENWVFGCDICQDVCPWNQDITPHREHAFNPHPDLLELTRKEWFEMDERRFNQLFEGTPVMRTKYEGLIRNLEFLRKEDNKIEP